MMKSYRKAALIMTLMGAAFFISGFLKWDRPDLEEKKPLFAAYQVCFDQVYADLNIDLNNQAIMSGDKEHYKLARSRIVGSINHIHDHILNGTALQDHITKNTEPSPQTQTHRYELSLKYLIALPSDMHHNAFYPIYDMVCHITAGAFPTP